MKKERATWPLWECLPDKEIVKLIILQWDNYGTKLHLMTDVYKDVEDLEEIDRLMRQKPVYHGGDPR